MYKIIIFCIALISSISYVKGETSNIMSVQVREQFEKESVVPDILDVYPVSVLNVSYPSGVKADLGNVVTPTQVKDQPTVQWEAKEESFYTLLMTDPDASSRAEPKFREVRHWLVVNIKGSDVASGETKYQFVGTGAPKVRSKLNCHKTQLTLINYFYSNPRVPAYIVMYFCSLSRSTVNRTLTCQLSPTDQEKDVYRPIQETS